MDKPLFNSHTHNLNSPDALINVEPPFTPLPDRYYSLGIHPWNAATTPQSLISQLDTQARLPQVKAIGETGIDANYPNVEMQKVLLRAHINLSEELGKPLVLHIVKAYNTIIELKKQIRPEQQWIIHGFRGKAELAQQLLDHGFFISLGEYFNEQAATIIPADRLLIETDTSSVNLQQIASRLPQYDNNLAYKIFKLR
ncbi:MAG: TatD family hydrolase [Muribaculum sp.]|nr:TatD family hydrolase [Muribaculaceae bacterium]MCM1081244.1 TatD family hydrolase [Muribaculum sp.]